MNKVNWGATIWLNILRSICAALVWFVFVAIFVDMELAWTMLLLPVYYPIFALMGMVAIWLKNAGVEWAFFFSLMASLAIVPGDPLVWVLSLIIPGAVPVDEYTPINLVLILFVTD